MSKQQLTSAPLDDADVAGLDRLCEHLGVSREHLVATAILRFVREEMRELPDSDSEGVHFPPYVETDPLTLALNEAEENAAEALRAYLKPGEDDIAAGRLIDHEDFMREMRERYRSRNAA